MGRNHFVLTFLLLLSGLSKVCESKKMPRQRSSNQADARKPISVIKDVVPTYTLEYRSKNPKEVKFTSGGIYQASIEEITPLETSIKCDLKMGVYSQDNIVDFIITRGNERGVFRVKSRRVKDFYFMDIKNVKRLNRESDPVYELTVVAQDSVSKRTLDTTKVNISVVDSNDNRPIFLKKTYIVPVSEDIAMHTSIARVQAVDADAGRNGLVYFSFKERTTQFAINPTSGVVTVTRKLDSTRSKMHRLTIVARDRALSRAKSTKKGKLIVKVMPVNQFSPVVSIKHQLSSVDEGISGVVYATLVVTDHDKGVNGHIDRVQITSGNNDGMFGIKSPTRDSNNFTTDLMIFKPLDRESAPYGYNITITAFDAGNPSKNSSLLLRVFANDVNDNNPEFVEKSYSAKISELAPPFTPVVQVSATDKDIGSNGKISYYITEGNDHGKFKVNSVTGQVYTTAYLDFERTQSFDLQIAALDGGSISSRRLSNVHVFVQVLDANDHDPVFKEPSYSEDLYEDLTAGTSVLSVSAKDKDFGSNGEIRYSIANVESVPFSINPRTGVITATTNLDRDQGLQEVIHLKVRASDFGSPMRRETETIVKFKIHAMNDNPPILKQHNCNVKLDRDAPLGVLITTIQAVDVDVSKEKQSLSYKFTFGNTGRTFSLDSKTGELRTRKSLYGAQSEYTLYIKAYDGVQYSPDSHPAVFKIHIVSGQEARKLQNHVQTTCSPVSSYYINAIKQIARQKNFIPISPVRRDRVKLRNRHAPVFRYHNDHRKEKRVHRKENIANGTVLANLVATDQDKGYNGLVLYSIVNGDSDSVFGIDMYSGEVFTRMGLDREKRDSYTLNISASDCGRRHKTAYTILNVNIQDVNDNSPVFDKPVYDVKLQENVTVGQSVVHVNAVDLDESSNGQVTYHLVSDFDGKFRIDQSTGLITVAVALDYEERSSYSIEVQALDGSIEDQKEGRTVVHLTVLDVNDNAPVVKPSRFNVSIPEDLLVDAVVTSILAVDRDSGRGGEIKYSLEQGTKKFKIDPKSGVIRLRRRLDFEVKSNYNLTVRVSDKGSPVMSSKVYVIVKVLDVNENNLKPVFTGGKILRAAVYENLEAGTIVLHATATDKDSWYLKYAIIDGTGVDKFVIDPDTGAIRTTQRLDREEADHYWLTVQAKDGELHPLFTNIPALIEVLDVNDEAPYFEPLMYYPSVPENQPAGTNVLKLTAIDPDSDGSNLTYAITKGNDDYTFAIDQKTGVITTVKELDRETAKEHVLVVKATDGGTPPKSATVTFTVKVTDENDHAPLFTESQYIATPLPRNSRDVPTKVFQVLATDRDVGSNADLEYSIVDGNKLKKFSINADTGIMYCDTDLADGESYDLTVNAIDNGRPRRSSNVTVIIDVVEGNPPSSSPPVFWEDSFTGDIAENKEVGSFVAYIGAEDPDNDQISFSIVSGDLGNKFTIDKLGGFVTVAQKLDREERSSYTLVVKASDDHNAATTQLVINVLDVNDNAPQPERREYRADVSEDAPVGKLVTTVKATDPDAGINGEIEYSIVGSSRPKSTSLFKIESATGKILTTTVLDYEDMKEHVLMIKASDRGSPKKSALFSVVISIVDVNDHKPLFVQPLYDSEVQVTSKIGTPILKVMATDMDDGTNAKLKYTIAEGNANGSLSVDQNSGVVSVSNKLNPSIKEYTIKVQAADDGKPSLASQTSVKVKVRGVVRKFSFDRPTYRASIKENTPYGQALVRVIYDGIMPVYEIVPSGSPCGQQFLVQRQSGVVSNKVAFDAETISHCKFQVRASSIDGQQSTAMVVVQILDQNDNPPTFAHGKFIGRVVEGIPEGSPVLDAQGMPIVTKATDIDVTENDKLTYEIVERSAFSVHPATGAITTNKILDYEKAASYKFKVKVTDSGSPRLSSFTDVEVQVIDVNDVAPVFSTSTYHATIHLPTFPNAQVVKVTATDDDSPVLTNLTFSLAEDDEMRKMFQVDTFSGVVTVRDESRITNRRYMLNVFASDGNLSSRALVNIRCEDLPVSALQFREPNYTASVVEGVSTAKDLLIPQVVGYPIGETITFSIVNPSDLFEINPSTGVVSILADKSLDRETIDSYQVVIQARDTHVPPQIAQAVLHVLVDDVNDNKPEFVGVPYYIVLQLGVRRNSIVGKATARDADIGSNGEIRYVLKGGDSGYFKVDHKTGDVIVSRSLDDVIVPKLFTLVVEANDKGRPRFNTEVEVKIKVVDRETPVFDQLSFSKQIREDSAVGTEISHVTARSPNGAEILYSITQGDPVNQFSIDFKSGMITVAAPLDYESMPVYKLTVRATDAKTSAHAEVAVDVTVTDVNDIAPVFNRSFYLANTVENTPIGTPVITVKAIDGDTGINKKIFYSIQNASKENQYFTINKTSGVLSVSKSLDYERHVVHEMIVVASDSGIPVLTGETRVRIVLEDANDNPPTFEKTMYAASILGTAGPGHFVMRVMATDPDDSDVSKLKYSIVSGKGKQHFKIDSKSGVITLSRIIGIQRGKVYDLEVAVSDGKHDAKTQVRVIIGDTNSHSPVFSKDVYRVDFHENYPEGTFVTMVTATDLDSGNYARISYSIDSVDAMRRFRIDADTGMIYSRLMFDRENVSQAVMAVPVRATDGGGRFGFCIVEVYLLDENDNQPKFEFKKYETTISMSVAIGTPVLMTSAIDDDAGSNSDLTYLILGHQTPPIFSIESITGVIKVARKPEVKPYNFFVLAKDNGNPQLRNLVPVEVTVLAMDVKILQFEKSKYDVTVRESASMGEVVKSLRLVVPTGTNPAVQYNIVRSSSLASSNGRKFSVDSSGRIKVAGVLDYETSKRYVMVVEANASSIHQVARTAVVINIEDVNDNKPAFVSNPYRVSIPENIDIGSKVLRVFAEDLDHGKNGEVLYTLSPGDPEVMQKFDIDQNTGWITTKGALDRESRSSFQFRVRAMDRGVKYQLSSETVIHATILDVNDSPPKFSQAEFSASVKEDALIGQTVATITAVDSDEKSDLFYFILSGDPQAKFGIERKTGVIFVHGVLDRESVSSYKLNVSASDGLYTSFTQVKIDIEDANDNAPICTQSIYVERMPEDSPIGSRVLTVTATDADIGVNAQLNFTVYGQGVGVFTVDKNTGYMSNLVPLDRETRPYYNFMVSAADIGGQACFTNVTILLDDVNDNKPVFTQRRYLTSVYEDAPLKKVLLQVKAEDADIGVNRKISYSLITDAKGTFEIETRTGMISLSKPLNRERKENYTIEVKAQDGGNPSLWSSAVVLVQVLNIHDVPPEFSKDVYHCNVSEDARKGTRIVTVRAVSRESSRDVITYKILKGPDSRLFRINSKSGTVRVTGKLDYEKTKSYTITVMASDTGPSVLTSTTSVKIDITDANDNRPVFSEKRYASKVEENSVIGTFVLQVFATDQDTGPNSDIRYAIVSGNDEGRFEINQATGVISVAAPIDREEKSEYRLVIRAFDQGIIPLLSETVATITVTDVNDNPPSLTHNNLTVSLQENSPMNSRVVHLRPHDKDGPGNGAPFTFGLISGDASKFKLHSDGLITKSGAVSHNDGGYVLRILVADNGHPPRSSDITLNIKIVKSVTHPPQVKPLTIYVNLYGSNFNGGVIGRVKGVDPDGDKLTFSFVDPPRRSSLRITNEGTVRAKTSLSSGITKLNVSVTDGRFTVYTSVTVIVSDITKELQSNSITLRMSQMSAGTFVEKNFEKCKDFFARLLKVPSANVHIWSMQSAYDDLDVVIAARKSNKRLFDSSHLTAVLNSSRNAFESQVSARLSSIAISQCQLLDCPKGYTCSDVYKPENKQIRVMSDQTSFISYEHSRSHTCTCKNKSGGCSSLIGKCAVNPCAPGYKCTDFSEGYQCKCVDPTKCDMDTTGCDDASCITGSSSRSFGGKSFIRYKLKETFNQPSRSVGLAVKTVKSEGTLVFAAGQYDYSILEIVKGFVQLRFDFGSGAAVVSIDWSPVNDGKWHHVAVERQGNHATLILDHGKHQASGKSPGKMRILNLNDNSIYFGAKVINARVKRSSGQGLLIKNGFKGCMQNLNLNGKDLPMSGSDAYASGYPTNAPPGCSTSGACRVPNTCPKASTCIETFTGRRCECLRGHSGPDCRPFITCSDGPCQNEGVCTDTKDGYRCDCTKDYTGHQCHVFIGACASAPCKNGGSCLPRGYGNYKCECPAGVSGVNCEFDQRPCASNPCYFNGNCTNFGKDFQCSCPHGLSGKRCELGFHCNRMPCLNGGSCDLKGDESFCLCKKGYTGLDCSEDVNECPSNPCKNDGVCVNTVGSFYCNCSSSSHGGPYCTTVLAAVTPEKIPLSMEAIIVIGVVLAVILLIVLIIVILLRRRAKKKRELDMTKEGAKRDSVLKVSPPVVGSELDSPTPPTPPPRIPDYPEGEPPRYESEETWKRNNSQRSYDAAKSLNNSESNVERYHWDYTDIPSDLVRPRAGLTRERSASYMGVPDNSPYPDGPEVPERSTSMMSSHSSDLDVPEVPQRPRNYRPSESDDQHLEVPPMPNTRRRAPQSRYSMGSEYSDMTDADYCRSVGGDSNYPDLFRGRFPGPPKEPYPESVDTLPVIGPYALTVVRDSELGSMTDFSEDDLERVYLGNSRMEACGDSPENTYLHSENASEDDREGEHRLTPEDPDFHQTLQNEIKEMMSQLEELKHESEL